MGKTAKGFSSMSESRFIGFCIGIPGQSCGKKIFDSDPDALELEKGVICGPCETKLFSGKSWSSQLADIAKVERPRGKAGRPKGIASLTKKATASRWRAA
jgi:hypothetical protein